MGKKINCPIAFAASPPTLTIPLYLWQVIANISERSYGYRDVGSQSPEWLLDSGSCSVLRQTNLSCLWGLCAFTALAFLPCQSQKQRTNRRTNELGVWVPAFALTSITKPWSELAQFFTSNKWTPWAAVSPVPIGGQAMGMSCGAEAGAGVHREWVSRVSLCYAAQDQTVLFQLEQSPSAVLLHRQERKVASVPLASAAFLELFSF